MTDSMWLSNFVITKKPKSTSGSGWIGQEKPGLSPLEKRVVGLSRFTLKRIVLSKTSKKQKLFIRKTMLIKSTTSWVHMVNGMTLLEWPRSISRLIWLKESRIFIILKNQVIGQALSLKEFIKTMIIQRKSSFFKITPLNGLMEGTKQPSAQIAFIYQVLDLINFMEPTILMYMAKLHTVNGLKIKALLALRAHSLISKSMLSTRH
jgi:hypothetical protein